MNDASSLLVREIMVPSPVTVHPTTTVADAARLMNERNIGAVVVATDGNVEGMFTERDLMRRAIESRREWTRVPVSQFMTPHPVTVTAGSPWPDAIEIMDRRRVRHLPVVEAGKLVGMLSVRDLLHHRARYLEVLVQDRTAELAARNTALIERDREITRNLQVAGRIQRHLLPERVPEFEPVRFAMVFHPHDQVTGDCYDFMPMGPDRLGILIGDVSGHGVPAAFVSVMAKTCFSAYCQGMDSPAAVLYTMNHRLYDLIEAEKFITMFVACVNRRTLELTYARAGHPLPLLYRAETGEVTGLDAGGMMIGVAPEAAFVERKIELRPGDRVLFYTDGVPECRNPAGTFFGVASLEAFLRREGHRPCDDLLHALEQELERFHGGHGVDDDVTIIMLEVSNRSTGA